VRALLDEWAAAAALADAAAAAAAEDEAAAAARHAWSGSGKEGSSGEGGPAFIASPPDLLSGSIGGGADDGSSVMAWHPTRSFGRGGRAIGRHWYWTARPAGALRDIHYRRPMAAAAGLGGSGGSGSGSSNGSGSSGGEADGAEAVFDENAAAAAAGIGAASGYRLASLDISPSERLIAVTEARGGGPLTLRVLSAGPGAAAACEIEVGPVAGPVVWACPRRAGGSADGRSGAASDASAPSSVSGSNNGEEGEEHLLFLDSSEMEVRLLSFPDRGRLTSGSSSGGSGGGGGGGDDTAGSSEGNGRSSSKKGAVVYRDPFRVRARLWRAPLDWACGSGASGAISTSCTSGSGEGSGSGGSTNNSSGQGRRRQVEWAWSNGGRAWTVMVAGLGPDDAPIEVWCLPPGAHPQASPPAPLGARHADTARGGGGSSGGGSAEGARRGWLEVAAADPAARVAVSTWESWLFMR
jgi:hypothetical protein